MTPQNTPNLSLPEKFDRLYFALDRAYAVGMLLCSDGAPTDGFGLDHRLIMSSLDLLIEQIDEARTAAREIDPQGDTQQ